MEQVKYWQTANEGLLSEGKNLLKNLRKKNLSETPEDFHMDAVEKVKDTGIFSGHIN